MTRTKALVCAALAFVPLVAWSKDASVVTLALGALAALSLPQTKVRQILFPVINTSGGLFAILFVVWSLASFFWAPHLPLSAWLKAVATLLLGLIVADSLARSRKEDRARLISPVVAAVIALVTVLLVERLSGGFIVGLFRSGQTTNQLLNVMNGGLVLLCCTSFAAAFLLHHKSGQWRDSIIFLLTVLVVTVSYRMDAVPVAFAAGILASLLVLRWRARGFVFVTALIGLVAVSWPVLAHFAYAADFHLWFSENVHPNWGYRIAIWGRVGELIAASPLIGYGFDASRVVGATAGLVPDQSGNTSFLHPHNGMLQIWLELGLVGVALLMLAAASVVRHVLACASSPVALAVAAGTFTASATIWLLSFGVWQGWWLAVLGLNISAVVLTFRLVGDTDSQGPG